MSKGPWKKPAHTRKETRLAYSKQVEQLRAESARQRQESEDRVMTALEESAEPLSEAQLVTACEMAQSTVQNAIKRLRDRGFVRKLNERRRVGRFGNLAYVYELGNEEVLLQPKPTVVIVRRDPLVAALFGEYRRVAA